MSYAVSHDRDGSSSEASHWKVVIDVMTIDGTLVERVTRTVMTNDGKWYVTYAGTQHQLKNLKPGMNDVYRLKLPAKRTR